MAEPAPTFELLWTAAGFDTLPVCPPDQTLRAAAPAAPPRRPSLPHLTIGEAGPIQAEDGPDLQRVIALGEGGMGVVWLARQASLGREVAVKEVRPEAHASAARALLREARFMGGLEHPNIVPVHALGLDDEERPLLVMKRVEGEPWRVLIQDPEHPFWPERGAARLQRHVEVLIDVGRAVAFAHARGVLHRDLKPENVMVGPFGEVYVMDWGVATALDAPSLGGVVGTPAYLAPEALDAAGRPQVASDVFLLGACLFEVLAGRPIHVGESVRDALAAAHAFVAPALPADAPEGLAEVVRKACARVPADRYASAEALRLALRDWLAHRAAAGLAEAARAHLDALRTDLAAGVTASAAVDERFAVARFGLRQALAAWPENRAAQADLLELEALMAEHLLARGDVEAAGALALGAPESERRSQLLARVVAARAQRERERVFAEQHDTRAHAPARTRFLLTVGFFAFVITLYVFFVEGVERYSVVHGIRLAAALMVAVTVAVAMSWRWVWSTAVNREMLGVVYAVGGGVLANRCAAWWVGAEASVMLMTDLILVAAVLGAVPASSGAQLRWAAPIFALGALGAALSPADAVSIFGAAGLVGTSLAAYLTLRSGRAPAG